MNVLLLTSHAIAEYDDLRMLAGLGYDVFSIGAYTDPAHPLDDKRPPLPDVPAHPELAARCEAQRALHGREHLEFAIDWAKADLHPDLIDWADAIIVHHYPVPWVVAQWPSIRHKRVIWRTCGQSDPPLERAMAPLHAQGLQIIRYSPAERRAFERAGCFAGEDAVIRFGKDPNDWYGWTGEDAVIGNVTQDMLGRAEACGYAFYRAATKGLPAQPAGPGSEKLPGGLGALDYEELRAYLRRIRVYLYTGTRPASYTLGLIEAMMTGVPVLSIDRETFGGGSGILADLFEAADLSISIDADRSRGVFDWWLDDREMAGRFSLRHQAAALFGLDTVAPQWAAFLGAAVAVAA